MKRLRTCDGCKRHVFVSERECPFCRLPLTAAPARADVSVPSGASRAQRLALAAALGGQGLIGCSQTTPAPSGGAPVTASPGGQSAAGGGSTRPPDSGVVAVPVYGAPVYGAPPIAPQDAGQSVVHDAGQSVGPVYGAPVAGQPAPRPDAGARDEDAGPADAGAPDAGPRRDGGPMIQPLYGAPAPVYGAPPAK